jgi:sulfide:quinone oxidoreductase
MTDKHYEIVIVGGGAAGISTAARLAKELPSGSIAIIEPSTEHYYQPIWTLVGGGVMPKEVSQRDTATLIPEGCDWIRDFATGFDPENDKVTTKDSGDISYEYLVVAAGIQINWTDIKGLSPNLGKKGICSNYSYKSVESTWENIRNLGKGTAIFTQPGSPIKCGGAPQKIMYLAEDHFKRSGLRSQIDVKFVSGMQGIFAVKKYADQLNKICDTRGIERTFRHDLVEVDADNKVAIFKDLDSDELVSMEYDMLHVTPRMGPPTFIKKSSLTNDAGWVDVDKDTMQHNSYDNIFACGDCSSLPTSKTAAAIRAQVPVMVRNILSARDNQPLVDQYDGYTSCPLVTGYGRLILAEFDYDLNPKETFPFDQGVERRSMYILKKDILPKLYWHGMLKGRF